MATLTIRSDAHISLKVKAVLSRRPSGVEDIANRCCASKDTIRHALAFMRALDIAEHDNRRPRTWKLREPEAA